MIASLIVLVLAFCPQAPGGTLDTLATYKIDGQTEAIRRADLVMDLARRERRSEDGVAARQLLVDRVLIRRAAEAKGLMPDAEAISAKFSELSAWIKAGGQDMETYLLGKGMSLKTFKRDYVTLVIAHERLVKAELELGADDQVSPAQLELWLKEMRASTQIILDPKRLPETVAARIEDENIGSLSFGELLLERMTLEERRDHLRQIALGRLLDARARSLGIEVSPEDAWQEVMRTKREVEADSRFKGIPYEKLLEMKGTTIEELARSEVTVANIQQRRIVLAEHSEKELRARLEHERAAILGRHGPTRTTRIILIRASDPPNELIRRSSADSLGFAQELRRKINLGSLRFAEAARLYSEEPNTKADGGQVGPLRELDKNLPPEVMAAVFHCGALVVPEPVRVEGGIFLVWVSEIGKDPSDAQLIAALRSELAAQLQQELFANSELDFKF